MHTPTASRRLFAAALLAAAMVPAAALAADRAALEREARGALNKLTSSVPAAKTLSGSAVGILVFPKITKAGLVVGGQYGDWVRYSSLWPTGRNSRWVPVCPTPSGMRHRRSEPSLRSATRRRPTAACRGFLRSCGCEPTSDEFVEI